LGDLGGSTKRTISFPLQACSKSFLHIITKARPLYLINIDLSGSVAELGFGNIELKKIIFWETMVQPFVHYILMEVCLPVTRLMDHLDPGSYFNDC